MSKKKLAGIIVGCVIVIAAIAAPLSPKIVTDYSSLLLYVRDSGASVVEEQKIIRRYGWFVVEGRRVKVNESTIVVFEYEKAKDMESEASRVEPDGFGFKIVTEHWWGVNMGVGCEGPKHFYKSGRIIVVYCGDNDSTISLLEDALGKQFAGV
jgi:hypothetical protein